MHSYLKFYKCPGDWTLLPWITTFADGWEINWLFVGFGRVSDSELDFYDEEID